MKRLKLNSKTTHLDNAMLRKTWDTIREVNWPNKNKNQQISKNYNSK